MCYERGRSNGSLINEQRTGLLCSTVLLKLSNIIAGDQVITSIYALLLLTEQQSVVRASAVIDC